MPLNANAQPWFPSPKGQDRIPEEDAAPFPLCDLPDEVGHPAAHAHRAPCAPPCSMVNVACPPTTSAIHHQHTTTKPQNMQVLTIVAGRLGSMEDALSFAAAAKRLLSVLHQAPLRLELSPGQLARLANPQHQRPLMAALMRTATQRLAGAHS